MANVKQKTLRDAVQTAIEECLEEFSPEYPYNELFATEDICQELATKIFNTMGICESQQKDLI